MLKLIVVIMKLINRSESRNNEEPVTSYEKISINENNV